VNGTRKLRNEGRTLNLTKYLTYGDDKTDENLENVSCLLRMDLLLGTRFIAESLTGTNKLRDKFLTTNLNMKIVWAKLVPRNVNGDKNLARLRDISETLEEIG
jgi:hypothetical protein